MKKISGLLLAFILMFSTVTAYAAGPANEDGVISHNGVKMFPVRTVATLLKANLQWNQQTKATIMIMEGKTVQFKAGEKWATVDGENVTLDHPAYLRNGRIYISEDALKSIWGIEIEYVDGRANIKIVVDKDIVYALKSLGNFKTLVAALEASGLDDVIEDEESITLFAPTDKAFEKLPKGTVDDLLKAENINDLKDILKYHVSDDMIFSYELEDGDQLEMLNGDDAAIEIKGNKAYIDGANISFADIETANGVIHVIDDVMIP